MLSSKRDVWVAGRGYGGAGGERLQVVLRP